MLKPRADPTLQRTRRRVHYLRFRRKQRRGPSVRDAGPVKPVLQRHSIDLHAAHAEGALAHIAVERENMRIIARG